MQKIKMAKNTKCTLWGILLGFILTVVAFLTIISQKFIEREIEEYLTRSTYEKYKIDIENIDVNIFTQNVIINNINIQNTQNTQNTDFYIKIDKLKFGGIAVISLFSERKLHMKSLLMKNPNIKMYSISKKQNNDSVNTRINTSELLEQLKPFLSSTLREISINDYKIEQANISHYTRETPTQLLNSIKKLDINIDQFILNLEIIEENKFFNYKDVRVSISDFSYELSDGNHNLSIERFTYLLNSHTIFGENLKILPKDTTINNTPLYWVDLPHWGIKSKISNLTMADSIIIDSLIVMDGNIRYKPVDKKNNFSIETLEQLDIYNLINKDFKKIGIKYLLLEAKSFIVEAKDSIKNPQYFTDLHFHASNIEIDSTSANNLNKFLYADNFELRLGKYQYILNKKTHRVTANDIYLSTYSKKLKAKNLELKPLNYITQVLEASIKCDSLELSGIYLPMLLHEKIMPVSELTIYKPRITLEQNKKSKTKLNVNSVRNNSFIYSFINNYLDGIYAKKILIKEGAIEYFDKRIEHSQYISTNFNFELNGFRLDSTSLQQSKKLFNADNFEISLHNYVMEMNDNIHILDIKEARMSSKRELVYMKDAHIHSANLQNEESALREAHKSQIYNIKLPEVFWEKTNILRAFFNNKLSIKYFVINNPNVQVNKYIALSGVEVANAKQEEKVFDLKEFYKLIDNYIEVLDVEKLNLNNVTFNQITYLPNGQKTEVNNKISMELSEFLLNKETANYKKKLPAKSFAFKIDNHTIDLKDGVHKVILKELNFASDKSILTCKDVMLLADPKKENYRKSPWHIYVSSPLVEIKNVDLDKILFDQIFDVGELNINSPKIRLYQSADAVPAPSKRIGDIRDVTIPMPKEIEELFLEKLTIKDGLLTIYRRKIGDHVVFLKTNINVELENVEINKNETSEIAESKVENYKLKLSDLELNPMKINDRFIAKELKISSKEKNLELKNFRYIDKNISSKDFNFIITPSLKINEIDIEEIMETGKMNIKSIDIDSPVFDIANFYENITNNAVAFTPKNIKLPIQIANVFNELNIESIRINNAKLKMPKQLNIDTIGNINLDIRYLQLDTLGSKYPFGIKNFTLHSRELSMLDETKKYRISYDNMAIKSDGGYVRFDGLKIAPIYSRDDYQNFFSYQNDYFYTNISNLTIAGFDIEKIILDKQLWIKKINCNNLVLYAYRDKRLPFNQANRPPMPQQLIKNVSIPFHIDSINITKSIFVYSEQADLETEPYKIVFNNSNVKLYPITNIPEILKKYKTLTLNADAKFLDNGELTALVEFDMLSEINSYKLNAIMQNFDLQKLTPVTENAALISVKSGIINQLDINFIADIYNSEGVLKLDYDNLGIIALKQKHDKIKERKLISFLANSFILPSNSKKGDKSIEGKIYWERDEKRFIFNYWWKSIYSGIVDYFGFGEEKKK